MVVLVFTTDDFSGLAEMSSVKSLFVLPTAQAFPIVHATDPGKLVVVIANAAVPVRAAVQVRVTLREEM